MSDFADDYKFGDIIYGRFDVTIDYWKYLLNKRNDVLHEFITSEQQKKNCPKILKTFQLQPDTTYDTLEKIAKEHADNSQTHFLIGYFHKGFKEKDTPKENLESMKEADPNIPQRYNDQRHTYHQNLYNSRYSPFSCLKIDHHTAVAQIGSIGNYDEYLRRACKFGVTNIKSVMPTATIRFALDNIPMNSVIEKSEVVTPKGKVVPITTSELRTLFRTWLHSKSHVVFYKGKQSVPAPWDEKPEDWLNYAKHRYEKYFNLLKKTGQAPVVNFLLNSNDAIAIDKEANLLKVTYEKLANFSQHQ
ncbi:MULTISPECIES: hypothetical protein [Chromobacterium]|uniref:hypothetical protein n=1 Tax=Chromobacterium TaxID=535 RepID=UPI000593F8B1|nr:MULTISPECIES: hypothetical protein [Chromobacterium]